MKEDELKHFSSVWLIALVGWTGLLWTLSSLEGGVGPDLFENFDKLEHFGYFLTGGFLFAGWRYTRSPYGAVWWKIILVTALFMGIMGAVDEFHQCFTPGRSGGDPWDWLADVSGSLTGALMFKFVHRWSK